MRRCAAVALLSVCIVGCGIRFQEEEPGAGAAGNEAGSGAMTHSMGGAGGDTTTGGVGGAGGSSAPTGPVDLTVCANPNDYGLNGWAMPGNADKLVNTANFGPTATVDVTFTIVFIDPVDITVANLDAQGCDIFQLGLIDAECGSGTTYFTLSQQEAQALFEWSKTPGNVVLGAQGYATEWGGYAGSAGVINPMVAPAGGSVLFNGPFGNAAGFDQGGSWRGKYDTVPDGQFCPLIEDSMGRVVAFIDRPTADVFFADLDIITALGGVTSSPDITSNNDTVFANLYALLSDLARNQVIDPCP